MDIIVIIIVVNIVVFRIAIYVHYIQFSTYEKAEAHLISWHVGHQPVDEDKASRLKHKMMMGVQCTVQAR